MSKTFEDVAKALREEKKTIKENKALCDKYPFLRWYGNPLYLGYSEDHKLDYKYTWEDELPLGWIKAFCPQMWDELKAILEKANYVDKFRFTQIKEKWGQLRLYDSGVPAEIADKVFAWEEKYLHLSEQVCIHCGKPAEYMTLGWISFQCENCARENEATAVKLSDLEEYYKTPREKRSKFIKEFYENNKKD